MPSTIFDPPYSGTTVPGFGNSQTHVPNTYVTPVNDTVVIPDLNPLPTILGTDVFAVDTTVTTYKMQLQQLAQWLQIIIPVLPFSARTTNGNFSNLYDVQYFGTNQTIAISNMVLGNDYSFYANGADVTITFTGGTLIGYTATGTSTTQLINAGEVLSFRAITSTIVQLR